MHENTFSLGSRQITICVRNESTHSKLSAQWKQTSSQIGHINQFCCVLGHIVDLCHLCNGFDPTDMVSENFTELPELFH